MTMIIRLILLITLLAASAGFMFPSFTPVKRVQSPLVQKVSSEELYEAAAECANGECSLDLVENLEALLEERKVELVAELSKVCSLEKSLNDLQGESELMATIRAIGRLFSGKGDNSWPEGMGTIPFSDDPKKAKDFWDYDIAWKNYYAKIEKEVGSKE